MVKRTPQFYDVDVVIKGQRHRGRYAIDQGMITVRLLASGASKTTQLGGGNLSWLAPMLLRELVAEASLAGH